MRTADRRAGFRRGKVCAGARRRPPQRSFATAGPSVLIVWREPALHGCQSQSTGSFDGFLLSVPWKPEGLGQVQGSVIQREAVDGCPEIQRVALHPAVLLEAPKNVLAEVDRKGPFLIPRMAVHRTATAALRTAAAQMMQQIQML